MSAMQAEVFEAFRSIDVPEDKALKAAAALASAYTRTEDDTTRSFAKRDGTIESIGKDVTSLKLDIAAVKVEVATVKGKVDLLQWMVALCISLLVTVLFKLFSH